MTRRLLAVMLLPTLFGAMAAVIVSLAAGTSHWLYFTIAFGLCVPAGLVVVLLQQYLVGTSPYGRVVAMGAGTAIRLVACFGGGLVIFLLLKPEEKSDKLAYWAWILFAYLTALVVEIAVFAKVRQPGA